MKVVHCVCYNEKFIPQQLDFLNQYFPEHEQRFYVMGAGGDFARIAAKNVLRLSPLSIPRFLLDACKADRIFFNGLFSHYIPVIFLFFPRLVKKGIWTPWGGDLYWKQYYPDTFKNLLIDRIRRIFICRLFAIASGTYGDYLKARELYGTQAKYLDSCPNIFTFDALDLSRLRDSARNGNASKSIKIIQLGNSADPSNEHIEMLDWMARFKHEDIQIVVPLAYGSDSKAYTDKVVSYGQKLFGERFIPLTKLMTADEYNRYLSGVDVMILNHRRQQGLGNMLIALCLGTKIYLRKEVSTWTYLCEVMGCKLYDTSELDGIAFAELVAIDEAVCKNNIEKVEYYFDRQWQKKMWEKIYS
jgi:hypothetical protein